MHSATPILANNWIDGDFVNASRHHESIDPATYEVIGAYADAGLGAAQTGVAAAKRASWSVEGELRTNALNQIADAFERNQARRSRRPRIEWSRLS